MDSTGGQGRQSPTASSRHYPGRARPVRRVFRAAQQFIHTEAASSVLLLLAASAAIVWVNSPWGESYADLWHAEITVDLHLFSISEDLGHWVNEAMMAIFFFLVGLEIKRELAIGELSSRRQAILPAAAALGGMVVPAAIYSALNVGGEGERGWGIPMATDIAFALGVLALLGRRVPYSVKVFLLALAIVDDLGSIIVIAVFYTADTAFDALGIAVLLFAVILAMNRGGIRNINAYVAVGALFWAAVSKSGVHATIAGVILGLLTPARSFYPSEQFAAHAEALLGRYREALAGGEKAAAQEVLGEFEDLSSGTEAPLDRLVRLLHPWSSYLIIPLFALANSGLELSGDAARGATTSAVTAGILFGLVVGKVVGIVGATWLVTRLGIASLPSGAAWSHIIGAGLVAGIGFTVSLFITGLAFTDAEMIAEAKFGIFAASILAGLAGYSFLRRVGPADPATRAT